MQKLTQNLHCENHKSAQPGSPLYAKASKQIRMK